MTDVYTKRLEETVVEGRRLGRHVKHDPRSRLYVAEQAPSVVSVSHAAGGADWFPLDQGRLGSCTTNAFVGARMLAPNVYGRGRFYERDAVWLYGNEQVEQGFSRNSDNGGTGLDTMKVAMAAGWITSFTHTFDLDSALRALVLRPFMLGTNWWEGFDTPNSEGVVSVSGRVRGGHEIVAYKIDADRSLVWFHQSWGTAYGVVDEGIPGCFAMSFSTLGECLAQGGDVTVPVHS